MGITVEEMKKQIRDEILAELKAEAEEKAKQQQEQQKEEPNYFRERYIEENKISDIVVEKLARGEKDGLQHYDRELRYLDECWRYYKDNDRKWQEEKNHVARKLGINSLELRVELLQLEGKLKV